MDCNSTCENVIDQGGDTPLNFALTDCNGEPFDISDATEIWAIFPTLVTPPVVRKLSLSQITVTNGGAGKFLCMMSKTNALLLKTGLIDCEVRVTIGGEITAVQIIGKLTVIPSLFPGV